ncbi:hypothetical protein [Akkermansia glycaniphila]|uniref:Uncharacterized protein n=1 Tax=Akkermansia glycaniphila TaxID=1679444 RepID=A0A1C7PD07_9BACT|nr:hypothetical protein [Akkermansia glycaniphila]OCA03319.1 hypothetical protein AC781_05500 [Akkermansia glycaniphila]SEH80570.1 Hypothetical protein PYTT_0890 [Akkermansia glycaniphila]
MLSSSSRLCSYASAALAAVVLGAGFVQGDESRADLLRKIERLEKQNTTLKTSYIQARQDADRAEGKLQEIRKRLEALGGSALGDSEQRLIDAMGNLEAANEELDILKKASVKLSSAVIAYMSQALTDDPAARSAVESALRETDVALGFRQSPARDFAGTLDNASVLSIDSDSGLVVVNVGREGGLRVGMPVEISRGDQILANTIVTDVRKEVAGVLILKLLNPALMVAVGDRATVKTNE